MVLTDVGSGTGVRDISAVDLADTAFAADLPSVSLVAQWVQLGGLLSYGFDATETYRLVADYVDRVLRGARPADLPVQQPSTFALRINQTTARTLKLTIPREVLLQATEIVE